MNEKKQENLSAMLSLKGYARRYKITAQAAYRYAKSGRWQTQDGWGWVSSMDKSGEWIIEGEKYHGTVDILVGGTPCQGFSVAGKQGGLGDPRSALCLKYIDLLKTMWPRWFVWENVPGVFSTNGGGDFARFISEIENIGYGVAWRVLDAQYVRTYQFPHAVPQRRRRVFVVGYFGDWRPAAEVLFEPTGLFGNPPPRRIKGKSLAGCFETGAGKSVLSDIECKDGPIRNQTEPA